MCKTCSCLGYLTAKHSGFVWGSHLEGFHKSLCSTLVCWLMELLPLLDRVCLNSLQGCSSVGEMIWLALLFVL